MLGWDSIVEFAMSLPHVTESTWDGTPALEVNGSVFAHVLPDLDVLVIVCSRGEKEAQLSFGDPAMFTLPHYKGYGSILIRLEEYDYINDLEELLTEAWRITLAQSEDGRETLTP
ncbi:MAG: hypothetical protein ABIR57_03840 [Aeromicrobium sp.]